MAFDVDPDLRIVLRAMTHGDLPLLARWLAAPHVRRWWHTAEPPTPEWVTATYGPRIDGLTPTRMWVVEVNGRSIGFVQDYRIREHPEFALLTPNPDAIGLDYAIGEPEWAGRGLGASILWTWMVHAARRFPDAEEFFAAPDHRNAASLRILDKVGFVQGTWFDEPTSGGSVATVVGCTLDVRRVLGDGHRAAPGPVRHDESMTSAIADALRLPAGPVDLTAIDPDAAPGFDGKKADGKAALAGMQPELADLQERLWAERTAGSERRILLVLQGMDTSGKGGVLRHTIGLVDPQGVRITSFKAPTEEERSHDFLWRIEKGLPEAGYVGVFDRSHYEDVLIARVRGLADPDEIERRYGAITEFEARLVDEGFSIVKCMLHISADEQKARLAERLANPEKHWKFNPGDLDERAHWSAYREAYEIALERTGTDLAPWHVVPADKKWFRNLAVGQILLDTLRGLDLQWPVADFDVAAETARLAAEAPVR